MFQQQQPNTEYLTKRLAELGISDQQNTYTRVWSQPSDRKGEDGKIITEQNEQRREYKIFDADEEGNIVIHYFNLLGQPYRWKKDGTAIMRDYVRKRLRDPKDGYKYHQDAGSGQYPFFNPGIIAKFKRAAEVAAMPAGTTLGENEDDGVIETLFVVEGEFKSFKGSLCDIDIIGLPSIHGFYNGDVKGKLHEDIQEVIITCKVKKIVFLVDADLLTLKWEENKDLHKRPSSFYGSIKAFRESLQLLLDDEGVPLELCYFMHIAHKYHDTAKGLDDLLSQFADKSVEIVQDLFEFNFAKKYFSGFSILDQNKDVHGRVFRYLGLTDEQEFYKTYKDFIGPHEFKFKRRRYVYDNEKREVVFVRHEDADKFMRIGPDWVKLISKLNKYGEKEEEVVSWKFGEIQRDYRKFPDFVDQIMRYDDFCNEPNWNGNYQRVIAGCYNLCEPLRWKAVPGAITYTIKFLKHIFQGQGKIHLGSDGHFESEEAITGDQFTVAMDYFTILMRHPKNMLPVPILVSPENGTGKSTVLKWMQLIFGSNMVILGNEQFKMKFNGHYITKFIIAVDEGFLEVDKKAEKERLKQLVTADSVYLENKGQNVRKINYFGKLLICSNDADRVMKIDDGESRWFVVRVPVIPIEERDPDLEIKLKAEMEAFLHFIYNRPIHHPRSDRLWFKPDWFITEQFKIIVETTKNRIDRVFEDWIREQFLLYKLPVLRYSHKFLTEVFNDPRNSKYKMDAIEIKAYLASKKMEAKHPQRVKIPIAFDMPEEHSLLQPSIIYNTSIARPYEFRAEDWLTPEQMVEFKKPLFDSNGALVTKVDEIIPKKEENGDDLPF
jgi:hypothetical protein